MSELELEEKIHDYITETYKAEYKGLLKVHKNNLGYSLILGIPSYMSPTTIASNHTNDQDFLDFIFNEIRSRNYMRIEFYKVIREENDSRKE